MAKGAKRAKGAASKPRRLKVFTAQLGFFESVVAVPNQAKALRAWGVHQNLFANGDAKSATAEDAIAAALAHPGTPLRRAIGSDDAFSVEPDLPTVPPPQPRTRSADRKAESETRAKAEPPRPDRSALDAADEALKRVNETQAREQAALEQRRQDLETEYAEAKARWREDRREAEMRLEHERRAYRQAGGEP